MSQTTVNQYFVARKQSFSVQPSKKRKIDSTDIEMNGMIPPVSNISHSNVPSSKTKEKIKTRRSKTSTRLKSKNQQRKTTTIPENKSQKPNTSDEVVKESKGSLSLKQAMATTPIKLIDCNIYHKSPLGKVEVNDVINDQAKSILYSRGSSILKASLKEKSITSPAKVSEVLLSMSPQKQTGNFSLDIVGGRGAGGSKVPSTQKKDNKVVDQELVKRREALRKKYSKLLKDETSTQPPEQSSNVEISKDTKYRMRNKYQHLLSKKDAPKIECTSVVSQDVRSSPQKAHEKYRHLTEKAPAITFQLPQKYKLLLEMFRSVDSILFLLQQRSEICTFDRLKKSVQSMSGREFTMNHLAAMKTIYPNGFVFRQEKGLYTSNGKTNNYQLTIEANFKDLQPSTTSLKNNSTVLISRRLKFENGLLEKTKLHHQKYLKKLNMKISDSEIHRWHPRFKLEEVPDVEAAVLPKTPITKLFTSAADVLIRNPDNLAPKVESALQKASDACNQNNQVKASGSTLTNTNFGTDTAPKTSTAPKNYKLKGVSSDLLERIRQKEQKKLELAMTRDPQREMRLSRIERLPEISRILKSFFTAEKKAAITVEDCVQKLSESYGTDLQAYKLEDHLHLLAELAPKWMQIIPVRKCLYVKLAKNYDINNVINTLNDHKKKEECG